MMYQSSTVSAEQHLFDHDAGDAALIGPNAISFEQGWQIQRDNQLERARRTEELLTECRAQLLYEELTGTEAGLQQVIERIAGEDPRGAESLAFDAGLIAHPQDDIPLDHALLLVNTPFPQLPYCQRGFYFAVDECAWRIANERAKPVPVDPLDEVIEKIIGHYKAGQPILDRMRFMIGKYAPCGQVREVRERVQARMGNSYPNR